MAATPESDAELLMRFRAGDSRALAGLYSRYEQPIYHFLLGMLRRPADAEDALQETFVLALRKSESVSGETLKGWLFTVAHRQAVLAKRREAKRSILNDESLLEHCFGIDGEPGSALEARETAAILRGLLDELPAVQREVIRLRIFEGLRFREIAERLGCPLNTALARLHDGLKKLRGLWEARYATA